MGLLGTLAKVAIGIAVAKGVKGMMSGGNATTGGSAPQGGRPQSGGLGDILDQLGGGGTQGGRSGAPSSGGGLGDLLGQLGGGGKSGGGLPGGLPGGLGDLLGQLAGGAAAGGATRNGQQRADEIMPPPSSGGRGGSVFDEMLGNAPRQRESGGSFGEIFNQAVERGGEPPVQPSQSEELVAALMLRAMIQAAKSDGHIDEEEKARLLENLDDVSPAERQFVEAELAAPIDVEGLASQVPAGLQQQVYAMSVAGIRLDDQNEAQYLHQLATRLGIDQQTVNAIHDQMQQPRIYS